VVTNVSRECNAPIFSQKTIINIRNLIRTVYFNLLLFFLKTNGDGFNPGDGGDTFLRNVGNHLQVYRRHNPDDQNQRLHYHKNLKLQKRFFKLLLGVTLRCRLQNEDIRTRLQSVNTFDNIKNTNWIEGDFLAACKKTGSPKL
jgi:hypothetical protein